MEFFVGIAIKDRTNEKGTLSRAGEKELRASFPMVKMAYNEVKDLLCVRSIDDRDDYLQEGYLALTKAYKVYDETCGKWQTYAMRSIKNAMIDYSKINYAAKRGSNTVPYSLEQIVEDGTEYDHLLFDDDLVVEEVGDFEKLLMSLIDKKKPKTYNIGIIALIRHAHGEREADIARELDVNYIVLRRAVHDIKVKLRENPSVRKYIEM